MNNQSFDKACKEKINSISGNNYLPDWDNFCQKLDGIPLNSNETQDSVFDHAVSEKLNHLPQNTAPQYLFNQVYQDFIYDQWRRHNIYVIKVFEILVVILLLTTFKNHFILDKQTSDDINELYAYASTHHTNKCVGNQHKLPEPMATFKNGKNQETLNNKRTTTLSVNNLNIDLNVLNPPYLNLDMVFLKNEHSTDITVSQKLNQDLTLEEHASPMETQLNSVHSEHAEMFPLVLSEMEKSTELSYEFSLGMGVNAYQINTPFDKVYSIASYKKETMATALAAGIGMTLDRWSILSGLEFSRLYYRPEVVHESFNMQPELFFETSLESIQFDLVHIPLKLRYAIWKCPQARFYAEIGVSTHLIWDATYDVNTYVRSGRPSVRYVEESPRLEEKKFTPGFSNNYLLKDNYFSGALIGLGGDIKIWKNIKVFGQVSYSRHFIGDRLGVGPNDDRIHYASGQAGLRWSIR